MPLYRLPPRLKTSSLNSFFPLFFPEIFYLKSGKEDGFLRVEVNSRTEASFQSPAINRLGAFKTITFFTDVGLRLFTK